MGLAAGQARLLSITARLTDNENSAQALSYSKQRLADQAEQVNAEYIAALDATKLTVLTGFNGSVPNYTDISYGLMTGYNTVACAKQYVVTDQKGRILVTAAVKNAYEASNGDINKFLEKMTVNGKTGFSQVDIDVNSDEGEQKIHEAWDKYITSVGTYFPDIEHDFSNEDVQFSLVNDDFPIVNITARKYSANFVNNDGNGNKIFDDLDLNATISMNQELDANGVPVVKSYEYTTIRYYENNTVDDNLLRTENANGTFDTVVYNFDYNNKKYQLSYKPWLNVDEKYLVNLDGKYPVEYYLHVYDETLATTRPADPWTKTGVTQPQNVLVNNTADVGDSPYVQNQTYENTDIVLEQYPLNYDGTTKEQRELYDYAVALTRAKYVTSPDPKPNAIVDDPENADIVTYLKNIFNQMKTFGYVTSEDAFHLEEKDSIKDNTWFEDNLKKGKLLLKAFSSTEKDFVTTTLSDDTAIQEVEDERKLALAEAKYTQDMTALESKDQKFDLELKKLDTEHSALQTEYDSLKSVVDKNVEKSFNIFS